MCLSDEFLSLDKGRLLQLVSSNELNVLVESKVFTSGTVRGVPKVINQHRVIDSMLIYDFISQGQLYLESLLVTVLSRRYVLYKVFLVHLSLCLIEYLTELMFSNFYQCQQTLLRCTKG